MRRRASQCEHFHCQVILAQTFGGLLSIIVWGVFCCVQWQTLPCGLYTAASLSLNLLPVWLGHGARLRVSHLLSNEDDCETWPARKTQAFWRLQYIKHDDMQIAFPLTHGLHVIQHFATLMHTATCVLVQQGEIKTKSEHLYYFLAWHLTVNLLALLAFTSGVFEVMLQKEHVVGGIPKPLRCGAAMPFYN